MNTIVGQPRPPQTATAPLPEQTVARAAPPQVHHAAGPASHAQPLPVTLPSRTKTKLVQDRRRHQRVKVSIKGRFMRKDKQEYTCNIINISPGGIAVQAEIGGQIGEHIVLYLEHMGRFEGELVRTLSDGFAVKLTGTSYKREKIANQLTWLINKHQLDLTEDRQHDRLVPFRQYIKVTLSDGSEQECRMLDVSLSGASVSILPKPDIGEAITLGLIRGIIIRHHDHGVGIRFLETQDPTAIERQFV